MCFPWNNGSEENYVFLEVNFSTRLKDTDILIPSGQGSEPCTPIHRAWLVFLLHMPLGS